jgi:hypothetical protein
MTLLLGGAAIAAIVGLYFWRRRARPARAHLYDPPHTPPTVPWVEPEERRGVEQ